MTAILQEALTETVMTTEVSGCWKGLKILACRNSVKLQSCNSCWVAAVTACY